MGRHILPYFSFNNNNAFQVNSQKHLLVILDPKLTFEEHLKNTFHEMNKTMGVLRKLSNLLLRQSLITIYEAFFRPYPGYADVHYDQVFNNYFHQQMESI